MKRRQQYGGQQGLLINTGRYTYIHTNTGSRHPLTGQSGQTMVEFALIVALLLAILFGIMEFGRAWFYSNHLTNSVRAAARYAAVLPVGSENELRTAVDIYLREEIETFMNEDDIAGINVNVVDNDSDGTVSKGDTIEVTVRYNFTVLAGSYFLPFFPFNAARPIVRSASMQYEG